MKKKANCPVPGITAGRMAGKNLTIEKGEYLLTVPDVNESQTVRDIHPLSDPDGVPQGRPGEAAPKDSSSKRIMERDRIN